MNHTTIIVNEDTTCIPSEEHFDTITLKCPDIITDIIPVKSAINGAKQMHPNAKICVNCHMMHNIQDILCNIQCLTLRLTSAQDFDAFLHMDNQLTPSDTQNKELILLVNDTVQIDGVKPKELPLLWTIQKLPA